MSDPVVPEIRSPLRASRDQGRAGWGTRPTRTRPYSYVSTQVQRGDTVAGSTHANGEHVRAPDEAIRRLDDGT